MHYVWCRDDGHESAVDFHRKPAMCFIKNTHSPADFVMCSERPVATITLEHGETIYIPMEDDEDVFGWSESGMRDFEDIFGDLVQINTNFIRSVHYKKKVVMYTEDRTRWCKHSDRDGRTSDPYYTKIVILDRHVAVICE